MLSYKQSQQLYNFKILVESNKLGARFARDCAMFAYALVYCKTTQTLFSETRGVDVSAFVCLYGTTSKCRLEILNISLTLTYSITFQFQFSILVIYKFCLVSFMQKSFTLVRPELTH